MGLLWQLCPSSLPAEVPLSKWMNGYCFWWASVVSLPPVRQSMWKDDQKFKALWSVKQEKHKSTQPIPFPMTQTEKKTGNVNLCVRFRKTDRGRTEGFRKYIEESGQIWMDMSSLTFSDETSLCDALGPPDARDLTRHRWAAGGFSQCLPLRRFCINNRFATTNMFKMLSFKVRRVFSIPQPVDVFALAVSSSLLDCLSSVHAWHSQLSASIPLTVESVCVCVFFSICALYNFLCVLVNSCTVVLI